MPSQEILKWKIRDKDLILDGPKLMGILNITPDSFSDGGRYLREADALARAWQIAEEGADLLDIGGESTRPGSKAVTAEEEWRRIGGLLQNIISKIPLPVSVDTRHGEVARRALEMGAAVINDVSGGKDPVLLEAVAKSGAGYVLMHMRGEPASMMEHARYENVVTEVSTELQDSMQKALQAGILPAQICLDPGFGFAKTPRQNYLILEALQTFADLGYPLLVGFSRKRMLRDLVGEDPQTIKVAGLTAALIAFTRGARLFRVHEVSETGLFLKTFHGLNQDRFAL